MNGTLDSTGQWWPAIILLGGSALWLLINAVFALVATLVQRRARREGEQ